MIHELKIQMNDRFGKAIEALGQAFNRIRTGRAHPSLLDNLTVEYYGVATPLSQVSSIVVEDARTLSVTPWDKSFVGDVEKSILKSDLGLNPVTAGSVIRIPLPALTEESRKIYSKQAKQEAEQTRISIRNVRRDTISSIKDLQKTKKISEDEEHRAQDDVQAITDKFISEVDALLAAKEKDLMEI